MEFPIGDPDKSQIWWGSRRGDHWSPLYFYQIRYFIKNKIDTDDFSKSFSVYFFMLVSSLNPAM